MDHMIDKDLELKNILEVDGEKFFVSTIKMEVRHSWLNQHQNVNVYETMVFEKKDGKIQYDNSLFNRRYTTYENAVEGHEHIVKNIAKIVKATRECRAKIIKD
jgi:vacuolar-type H+-ATPase subunit E/Vma4